MHKLQLDKIIEIALQEDMNNGDVTTDSLIEDESLSVAEIMVKEKGIIAGLEVAEAVFRLLDTNVVFEKLVEDGIVAKENEVIAVVKGKTRAILSGERTALNLLQRLSGIATLTSRFVKEVEDYNVRIVDTRKTTPGLRYLEKYAVRMGGGFNHRYNLSDAVMIKDNHIEAAGGIGKAIDIIRSKIPHTVKIEIEVETLEGLIEAINSKADIVMLDNMSLKDMEEGVKLNMGRVILEASGNITLERVRTVAETGVDIISIGALTHSVSALDISLNIRLC